MSRLHVREAALGDQLEPATALVAPAAATCASTARAMRG
jgi:chemotaxis response regulator CheB